MGGKVKSVQVTEGLNTGATIQNITASGLTSYATDAAFVTAKGSAAAFGDIYGNSTWNVIRFYTTAWQSVDDIVSSGSAPTVNDDNTVGRKVGSVFVHTLSTPVVYMCVDASTGAAVWLKLTNIKNNSTTSDPGVNDDNTAGYEINSKWTNETSDVTFICADASTGAAVWNQVLTGNNTLSYVRVRVANGYGSTDNKIRRFSSVIENVGSDITYNETAANGSTFTCGPAGIYTASYTDNFTSPGVAGLSLNSSELTTSITGLTTQDDALGLHEQQGSDSYVQVNWTGYVPASGVIRPHNSGVASGTVPNIATMTVARIR